MEAPDWSGKQLRKLGEYLRNSENTDALPFSYNDVRLHFSSLAATVQSRILEEDWRPLLGHRAFEVTSRAKTLDTVIEKLLPHFQTSKTSQACDLRQKCRSRSRMRWQVQSSQCLVTPRVNGRFMTFAATRIRATAVFMCGCAYPNGWKYRYAHIFKALGPTFMRKPVITSVERSDTESFQTNQPNQVLLRDYKRCHSRALRRWSRFESHCFRRSCNLMTAPAPLRVQTVWEFPAMSVRSLRIPRPLSSTRHSRRTGKPNKNSFGRWMVSSWTCVQW